VGKRGRTRKDRGKAKKRGKYGGGVVLLRLNCEGRRGGLRKGKRGIFLALGGGRGNAIIGFHREGTVYSLTNKWGTE